MIFKKYRLRSMLLLLLLLALGIMPVSAQTDAQPITLGAPASGAVTVTNIAPAFSFILSNPGSINVQVQATTQGFAPAFRLLDANGGLVQDVANPSNGPLVQASIPVAVGGGYVVQVQSANGAAGQFTVQVDLGGAPPTPLNVGQVVETDGNPQTASTQYTFNAGGDPLELSVQAEQPNQSKVTLLNAEPAELASFSLVLSGAVFNIPANSGSYTLEVAHSGGDQSEPYSVELREPASTEEEESEPEPEEEEESPPAQTFVLQPLPNSGACVVASAQGGNVNIRNQPSVNDSQIVGTIFGNATATVSGKLADESWYRVNYQGLEGWMARSVIRTGGDCSATAVIDASGGAAPLATNTPAPVEGDVELRVSGISTSPSTVIEDQNFSVNITIQNDGSGTASNVKARLIIEDADDGVDVSVPSSETTISSIAPGSSTPYTFEGLNADDNGSFDIRIRVDPDNTISETNEGNNDRELTVEVSQSRADLVITRLDADQDSGTTSVDIIVTAHNQGTEESNNFTVSITVEDEGGDTVATTSIDYDDLNPDESAEKSAEITVPDFDNDYKVIAVIDSGDTTEEINEDNNTEEEEFDVNE
jgi:hypothetical protein